MVRLGLVVGFCCRWCSYAAADLAGTSRMSYPPSVLVVRVPCSGAVDPGWILSALASGADAVFVAGCRRGECHYVDGNEKAEERVGFVKALLEGMGLEPERVELFLMSAGEPQKFVEAAREMSLRAERLPPLDRRALEVDVGELRGRRILALSAAAIARTASGSRLPSVPGLRSPVFSEECIGCGACVEACPEGALRSVDEGEYRVIEVSWSR
ncbi:MAG: hypothetical protein DRO06_01180, partial [Thermoproteota archaeon]